MFYKLQSIASVVHGYHNELVQKNLQHKNEAISLLDSSPVLIIYGGSSTYPIQVMQDFGEFLSESSDVIERCFPPKTMNEGGVIAKLDDAAGR